ncbi:hypothetical protein G6F43_012349 [Rhizopus delemar]|nr:hypothetical protein G6F43_012349 [Rhizopus delemar]
MIRLCSTTPTTTPIITTEIEAMDTVQEDIVGTHVDTEDIEEDEILFLGKTKLGIPTIPQRTTTRTTTTTTTIPATTTTANTVNKVTITNTSGTQLSLYYPTRRYKTRRTPTALPSILGNNRYSQVATINRTTRLQNSIPFTPTTMETKTTTTELTRTTSSQRSSGEIPLVRHNRNLTNSEPRLSIALLHYSGTEQTTTHLRLSKTEQFYPMPPFQDGRSPSSEGDYGEKRLSLQDRSKGRLCSGTNPPSVPQIFNFQEPRYSLPIQDTGIWNERDSTYFLEADEVCDGTFEERRGSTCLLPRRYLPVSQISTRNEDSEHTCTITFRETRVSDKQREEHTNTPSTARIPRILFQLKDNENYSTCNKIEQIDNQSSSSITTGPQDMQVDCQSFRENDLHDSGNWGSVTTHKISTERPRSQPSTSPSTMGINLCAVEEQQRRITMVDTEYQGQEWPIHSADQQYSMCTDNSCRRLKHSLGSSVKRIGNYGLLDRTRKRILNKRQRANGYLVRLTTTCKKISKHKYKNIYRQYYSFKIRDKIRRHLFFNSARPRHSDSRPMQQVSATSRIPTHSRSSEYTSGLPQPSADSSPIVRSDASQTSVQQDSTILGSTKDRRICFQSESPIEHFLEPTPRPTSSSDRCLQSDLVKEGNVPISTLEIHTTGNTNSKTAKNRGGNTSHSELANATLVSDDSKNATISKTDDSQSTKLATDRLEIIRKKKKNIGMTEDAVEFPQHSLRANTIKLYNNGWRIWTKWCKEQNPVIDPEQYNTDNVFHFLMDHRNYSVSHLNGIRSACVNS